MCVTLCAYVSAAVENIIIIIIIIIIIVIIIRREKTIANDLVTSSQKVITR